MAATLINAFYTLIALADSYAHVTVKQDSIIRCCKLDHVVLVLF